MNHKELTDFFVKKVGIAVNQGRIFGIEGDRYVRVNIATSRETVVNAMNKLKTAIDEIEKSNLE